MADIENTLAVAKDSHVIVYNAPNDETGQTELDEYTTIANQDRADTISSSWGTCENDVTAGYVQAENTVFEQMAFQGQSVFAPRATPGRSAASAPTARRSWTRATRRPSRG